MVSGNILTNRIVKMPSLALNKREEIGREDNFTLVPIKNASLKEAGIPLKAETFYKWRKQRKNLKIFTKIGGRVFIVRERWDQLIKKGTCPPSLWRIGKLR